MTSHILDRLNDGDDVSEATVEAVMRRWVSQQLGAVQQQRDDALRAGNDHPDPICFFVDQLENYMRRSAQVLEESRNSLAAMLDGISTDSVREMDIGRFTGGSLPSFVKTAMSRSDRIIIDLTQPGPRCRKCQGVLEESQATVYSRCGCVSPISSPHSAHDEPKPASAMLGMRISANRSLFVSMAFWTPVSSAWMYYDGLQGRKAVGMCFARNAYRGHGKAGSGDAPVAARIAVKRVSVI
ncbi:hypothetical protein NPX13_g9576 [Xylaria arbuscula]|uniref:Uncharacterized protein n=1 Tax=Xylaria arbuscula TaxID=114810 RepID=A0A9W8THK2_9PEZI|nr:hypothetical protein NPX13_g9576 [Xylaria arbuscula]